MAQNSQAKQSDFNLIGKMRRSENSKGKKSNVVVPESLKLEKSAPPPPTSELMKMLQQNASVIVQGLGVVIAIAFAYSFYSSSSSAIENLVNANPEALKTAFMGDMPYLFYCHRGGNEETVPQSFIELNKLKSSKMGFAVVNCSQVLPSGKNLWDRFKLKKEVKPTIFETAPWTKPTQVPKKDLKDMTSLKKFVEVTMAPKGVDILTDKDLMKNCGFSVVNKSANADPNSRGETCFVLVKGSKYTKFHSDLEERIVRAYPKVKIVKVDAVKKRLSFEDPETLPGSMFALKMHALRNSTHYMSMVNPLTWDYVSTFMSQAISSPSYSYSGETSSVIKLIKTGSSAFKNRSAPKTVPSKLPTIRSSKLPKSSETKKTESSETKKEQPPPETVAERFAREKRRRDEMERQSREHLFEDEDKQNAEDDGDNDDDEDEDENIIEL